MSNDQSSENWLNRIGFKRLLVSVVSVGILLLTLLATVVSSSITGRELHNRIEQEGMQLLESFTGSARLGLLYQSQVESKTAVDNIMSFPDIDGAAVYIDSDPDTPLYYRGEIPDMPSTGWPEGPVLEHQNEEFWIYTSPVFSGSTAEWETPFSEPMEPELLGYVRIIQSKSSLQRMLSDIYVINLLVSLGVAGLLLLLLIMVTNRITKPVLDLASIMRRAQEGETDLKANLEGTREIVEMESAFNTMMSVLRERETELEKARDIALEAARIKGEFAANVSHELRTPMNGVLGMLELLSDLGLSAKQQEYLEIATSSAETLLGLIDDILDFSKSDAGKIALESASFNLHDLLEEITTLLSIQAHRKNLQLFFLLGEHVPMSLLGDAGRLRQVLVNLMGNGIKFTEWGEVYVQVERLDDDNEDDDKITLKFTVADTGMGIPEDVQKTIFEAFSQADSSTTKRHGGTGLGLAISRQLVELMDGEIGVVSTEGEGSSFWFTVKMEPVTEEETCIPARKWPYVLIADSNPRGGQFAAQQLRNIGISSKVVESSEAALFKLRHTTRRKFDLLLIDENITGLQAEDLSRIIETDPELSDLHILIMVNRHNPVTEQYSSGNIGGFLHKPIKFDEIQRALQSIAPSNDKNQTAEPVEPLPRETTSLIGARVLVVEDNRSNQKVALGMLERLGCSARIANNGREAVDILLREPFDVVLMDCHMPEMDGYETTAQIRVFSSETSRIPIIAMTANVQQGEHEKCIAVGMDDFLGKPLKLETLRAALERWTDAKVFRLADNDEAEASQSTDQEKSDAASPLDPFILEELEHNIGDAMGQMLTCALEDLPHYFQNLERAAKLGDIDTVADMAHTIKGTAINIGARQLHELAKNLETKGRAGDISDIDSFLEQINVETTRSCKALAKECIDRGVLQANTEPDDSEADYANEASFYSARILVVDDDRSLRVAIREAIETPRNRVDEVANGEQAIMYCERFMPDLILMDAVMPEMDGFDASQKILSLPGGQNVTIIIITALNDESSISRAFAAGAMDYIPKPINFAVLKKRVLRLLQAKQAESHVRQLAYNDVLTGLPNRRHFTDKLAEYINRPQLKSGMIAVLFLDLDRFKLINDTFGHDSGDLLLKVIAERLVGCVRQGDLVSRFGGDEFVVMLSNIKSYAAIEGIAAKIQQTLARPFVFLGKELRITTSIGIATYPDGGDDINILLKNADLAMYRAKRRGNTYEFFESRMEEESSRRLALENDLRGAIERGEMHLFYQPQIEVTTGELIGVEALIRWKHPFNGFINPLEFIGLAEETGQIHEIGEWVLNTACRQLKQWHNIGFEKLRVAVNISGRQLDRGDLHEVVDEILKNVQLPPASLELEITESTIMENAEDVIGTLQSLKQMGVSLAIDDFGTGYSSLSYLRRFPIDLVKVDREFVRDADNDKVDADIVNAIITLAHALGLDVLAEGVETDTQHDFLRSQGCDYLQGYLFGKPMPADELASRFLKKKSEHKV